MSQDFEAWYRDEVAPFEGALRARLGRVLPSAADAEDVLWTAYERLFASGSWRNAERPVDLVFKIARNLAIDQLRRQKVVAFDSLSSAALQAVFEGPRPDERLDHRRAVEIVNAAIAELPPKCRQVFVMRRVWDLPPREIAAQTGLSVYTIEKHVAKGLRLCAERLAQVGLERTASRPPVERGRGTAKV